MVRPRDRRLVVLPDASENVGGLLLQTVVVAEQYGDLGVMPLDGLAVRFMPFCAGRILQLPELLHCGGDSVLLP